MADKAGMHGDEALQFGEPGAGERTSVAELPAPPGLDFGEVDSALQRVVGAYSAGFGSIFKGLCAELNQQVRRGAASQSSPARPHRTPWRH